MFYENIEYSLVAVLAWMDRATVPVCSEYILTCSEYILTEAVMVLVGR